jgi:glycosyltransferase involved in cell wall biosynthesis
MSKLAILINLVLYIRSQSEIYDFSLQEHGRQLRIAQVGNTSGVASAIAAEQRAKGHEVDVFVFDDVTEKQFGGTRINYNSFVSKKLFFRRLSGYEIWHYHYPYGSLKANLESRKARKVFLKHYHGDDLRGKREDDFCAVATPDLLEFAPLGEWIPNPVDFVEINAVRRGDQSSVPRVAHYPYYEAMKSLQDYHSAALKRLEERGLCSVSRIIGMPHGQSLEAMASCDVVVGKILPGIGWFGKFELEGMALGKPVIAYVSEELYEKYRPPVFRTTKDTFERDLVALLRDENERARLSREGSDYVRNNHDARHVLGLVESCYRRLSL